MFKTLFSLIVLLLAFSYNIKAEKRVMLHGTSAAFKNSSIIVKYEKNPITEKAQRVDTIFFNNKGSFKKEITISSNIDLLELDLGSFLAELWVFAEEDLEIILPHKLPDIVHSPIKERIVLYTKEDSLEKSLNNQIIDIESKIQTLELRYIQDTLFSATLFRSKIDSIVNSNIKEISGKKSSKADTETAFLGYYTVLRLQGLLYSYNLISFEKLLTFIEDIPSSIYYTDIWRSFAYDIFKDIFHSLRNPYSKDLGKAIAEKSSITEIATILSKGLNSNNQDLIIYISSLALYQEIYQDKYDNESIKMIFTQILTSKSNISSIILSFLEPVSNTLASSGVKRNLELTNLTDTAGRLISDSVLLSKKYILVMYLDKKQQKTISELLYIELLPKPIIEDLSIIISIDNLRTFSQYDEKLKMPTNCYILNEVSSKALKSRYEIAFLPQFRIYKNDGTLLNSVAPSFLQGLQKELEKLIRR